MEIKININEMLKYGVHLGHRIRSVDPIMRSYVFRLNDEINIINLEYTKYVLEKSLETIYELIKLNKIILIICTRKKFRKFIKAASNTINMPYINRRWLGGILTNFPSLRNSINRMKYIKEIIKNKTLKIKKRDLHRYKKKYYKLKKTLEGIKNMQKNPDIIFIIDSFRHKAPILEAKKRNIPIICIVDTNNSPKNISFPIPGNDDSIKSIFFYLKLIVNTVSNVFSNNEKFKL